jgi:hypothetical protein
VITHDAPEVHYDGTLLPVNVTVDDDEEVAYHAVQDPQDPSQNTMVFAPPGATSVTFVVDTTLEFGENFFQVTAADTSGNVAKELINITYACLDCDGDGFNYDVDCDDNDPSVYPGAPEICNGKDSDCNGLVDDNCTNQVCDNNKLLVFETCMLEGGDEISCMTDAGFSSECVSAILALYQCAETAGCLETGGLVDPSVDVCAFKKCPEEYPLVFGPKIPIECTTGDMQSCGTDTGECVAGTRHCVDGWWDEVCEGEIGPAPEYCNGLDENCNGIPDDEPVDGGQWFFDLDGDGHAGDISIFACDQPEGTFLTPTDCDDERPEVHPGATEVCYNEIDEDCDGVLDNGCPECFDLDGDFYTTCDGDCDDSNSLVNPGEPETCANGIDDNCDGWVDEGCACQDVDGDGYSNCDGDCNDSDDTVYPGAEEICGNGIDDNCDGAVDEGCDCFNEDGDGYSTCEGDCNDSDGTVYPGAEEICQDGVDNDCNGVTDTDCIGFEGCCSGEVAYWYGVEGLQSHDCSGDPSCGWDAELAYYWCGTTGEPDPSGVYPMECPF